MRTVVIGLGGIGSNLLDGVCRLLSYSSLQDEERRVLFIDGDAYNDNNRRRQRFLNIGNKAIVSVQELKDGFPELSIEAKPHFVDEDNIFLMIREGDAVLLCVDNHATRKLVSDHVCQLQNVFMVSGGNTEFDGNIQIYTRCNGVELTPPLTWLHPEIENPADHNPAEVGCDERTASGQTQLLRVNATIAAFMLNAFGHWLETGKPPVYYEQYFDARTGNARAVISKTDGSGNWVRKF